MTIKVEKGKCPTSKRDERIIVRKRGCDMNKKYYYYFNDEFSEFPRLDQKIYLAYSIKSVVYICHDRSIIIKYITLTYLLYYSNINTLKDK